VNPSRANWTRALGAMFFLTMIGCGLFRPSLDEVRSELSGLIDPALDAALGDAERPDGNAEGQPCHEPLVGPANGIRPLLVYRFSFSSLDTDPEIFLERVEQYWRTEGLEVQIDEDDNSRRVHSGKDGYNIRAAIVYESKEASIGGTGPCVDDPAAD
jgi:hypothetical protein